MLIFATTKISDREIKKLAYGRRAFINFSNDDAEMFVRKLQSHNFERINLANIIIESRSGLRKEIIDFSGGLNKSLPHSNWWAIGLSRRVAMYRFCSDLAKLFIIKKIVDLGKWDVCVICDTSISPWKYLEDTIHQADVRVSTGFSLASDWKFRLSNTIPLRTILWVLRKIGIKSKLGWKPVRLQRTGHKSEVIMFTLIDKNNFSKKEGDFRDLYLGDLAGNFNAEKFNIFTLGQLHDKLSGSLLHNINAKKDGKFALVEHFWSFSDLLRVFADALKDFFATNAQWNPSHFAGFELHKFLNAHLKWEMQSGYADNLLYYKGAKNCFQQMMPDIFIYPYENKCIEHMLLNAISKVSPRTMAIGYQHAVLTPKHIHMFLAKGEAESLPLPYRIVTNGPHTARTLLGSGNYPEHVVMAGAALRQTSALPDNLIKNQPPSRIKNVLITLAEGIEEYDKAFVFLRHIQRNNTADEIDFRIRLHPGIPYDPFKNKKLVRGIRCTKDTTSALLESLYLADIVLYASTSVAVQAIAMGIPVIWMDLLDLWGTDPIINDDLLRWKLSYPEDWSNIIKVIEQLSCLEFNQRLEKSKKFASDCFCNDPINIENWLKK